MASMATISACIFLFCIFYSVISNVQYMVKHVESSVGITVLFDEDFSEGEIQALGVLIGGRDEVREIAYTSPEEAWEEFKKEYFAGNEELADGFADDNPLAGSASFEIYLNDISQQQKFVGFLEALDGVRQVNYSSAIVAGFASLNRAIGLVSLVIVGVLLAVSVFLISNTISVAASFCRQESQIMRLIGATNFMIRAPFIVEGVVIGLFGAAVPLAAVYVLYTRLAGYLTERFQMFSHGFEFMPLMDIYPEMFGIAGALGVGIGFFGSFFTIRKYLKV